MENGDYLVNHRSPLFLLLPLLHGALVHADPPQADSAQAGPNVIIIMADDQGYQDLGCFGSTKIKTPEIDRMAREGMRFTDFYSGAPVCTPSRASLLTGCYAARVGNLPVLFPRSERGLNPSEITIAEILKTKDYATTCIRKWHLGHQEEFLPIRQGFDMYYGVPYSNDMTLDPSKPPPTPSPRLTRSAPPSPRLPDPMTPPDRIEASSVQLAPKLGRVPDPGGTNQLSKGFVVLFSVF